MLRLLLALLIVVPLFEIWLMLQVGHAIGALPTVASIMATAALGVYLIKRQGQSTVLRAREKLAAGEVPAPEMAEGAMLALAGMLLLTPGFFTDCLGFCCLIPPLRRQVLGWVARRGLLAGASVYGGTFGGRAPGVRGEIIEGEFEREGNASQKKLPPDY